MKKWSWNLGWKRKPLSDEAKSMIFALVTMMGALMIMILTALYWGPWWAFATFCWIVTQWQLPWPE